MNNFKRLYINFYVLVYALYAFFNKGIAYSYVSELLFVVGIVMLLKDFKNLEIVWNRPVKILFGLIAICFLYIIRAIGKYPFMEIIRDSFIINYALFVFILFMLRDEIDYLKERLFALYKWFPIVVCFTFLLFTYIPFFQTYFLFGEVQLLLYKFGDMGVQLLICSLLMLNGYVKMSKRWAILNTVLTIYLFLVIAAYSRSGALSYLLGMGLFFVFMKNKELKQNLLQYLKFAPIVGLIAISFYVGTKVQDNFQGRKVGLDQLKENALSIIGENKGGTLTNNKTWRLLWWAKIIDYTLTSENFALGKGLGMSLSQEDESDKPGESDLRSPHNFHLNILARFGVPIFLLWCYWLFLHFKIFRDKHLSSENLMYLSIFAAFIVNASFDVYLEGPMGAFPFWTFLGIFYISYFKTSPKQLGPI